MVYKIMSAVKAHLNTDNQIVSPTQTLLKHNLLKTSKLMPKDIQDKIVSANVVVDRNSLYKNSDVCRGDIYVETTNNLSVVEQRHLVTGMSHINKSLHENMLQPIIIRTSPDKMPNPVNEDVNYDFSKKIHNPMTENIQTESAFVVSHVSSVFENETNLKNTYRKADAIAKALNKELNTIGLRTVFADMSVCSNHNPITRETYMIFQKTSRFNSCLFSNDKLNSCIKNVFQSEKLNAGHILSIEIKPFDNQDCLIGSISLENVALANKKAKEQLMSISNLMEAALVFSTMEKSPIFVNGINSNIHSEINNIIAAFNVPRPPHIANPVFANDTPIADKYESSNEQPLSPKWKPASAIMIHVSGKKTDFNSLYKNANDIVLAMNDIIGCDESNPFIKNITFGSRIGFGNNAAQAVFISYSNKDLSKNDVSDDFLSAVSEYSSLSDMKININQPIPLQFDTDMAKPIKKISVVMNKPMTTNLKSNVLPSDFENNKEQQISL